MAAIPTNGRERPAPHIGADVRKSLALSVQALQIELPVFDIHNKLHEYWSRRDISIIL